MRCRTWAARRPLVLCSASLLLLCLGCAGDSAVGADAPVTDRAPRKTPESHAPAGVAPVMPAREPEAPAATGDRRSAQPGVFAAQLHLHGPVSEGSGSYASHLAEARRLGNVDVLWFTEHDWRFALHTYATRFGFERGLRKESYPRPDRLDGRPDALLQDMGWRNAREDAGLEVTGSAERRRVREGKGALRLTAVEQGGSPEFSRHEKIFRVKGHRDMLPLAAGARVRISIFPLAEHPDVRLFFRFDLSQQPPDSLPVALVYQVGGPADATPGVPTPDGQGQRVVARRLELEPGRWSDVVLELTEDAVAAGIGGMDNAVTQITLGIEARNGAGGTFLVDDMQLERDVAGEPLRRRTEKMLAELAGDDIALYMGLEMSFGAHLNAFGPVPVLDHEAHPGGLDAADTVSYIHRHGGLALYNHIFGVFKEVPTMVDNPALQKAAFDSIVARMVEARAYGADAVEVGYPLRGGMPMEMHLRAWDHLGMAGIILTGVGTSDSHSSDKGWQGERNNDTNNWLTWIRARSRSPEDLMDGIRSGDCSFGNPVRFRGRLDLSTPEGARMGQVVVTRAGETAVRLRASGLQEGWRARVTINAESALTLPADGTEMDETRTFPLAGPVTVVRWCIEDADGEAVACTNPLYYMQEPPEEELPAGRLFVASGRTISSTPPAGESMNR